MKKLIVIIAAAAAIGTASYYAYSQKSEAESVIPQIILNSVQNTESTENTEEEYIPDNSGPDKSEKVYVTRDSYGNVKDIKVEVVLAENREAETVYDFTRLYDIKNKDGGEEFTVDEDGYIEWENLGNTISYEGKTDDELPVSVNIRYFLEDREVTAEEIAGKSGNVKIRFDYENKTRQTVKVNGTNVNTVTPFIALTAVMLDDGFVNVEVENGQYISRGDSGIVVGYALPGLSDSLKLSDYELTKDAEIPEFVEITAYAKNFKLEYTATVFTTGLFEDIENEDLKKLDEFADDIDDMKKGVDDMRDGANKLYDGTDTLKSYMKKYVEGVNSLCDYADRASAVFTQTDTVLQSVSSLSEGLNSLSQALDSIDVTSLDSETQTAVSKLREDADALSQSSENIQGKLSAASSFKTQIDGYISGLTGIDTSVTKQAIKDSLKTSLQNRGIDEETIDTILSDIDYDACLQDILNQIAVIKDNISQAVSKYDERVSSDITDLINTVGDIEQQAEKISSSADSFSAIAGISESVNSVKDSARTLAGGASQLSQGLSQIKSVSQHLSDSNATESLKSAGTQLNSALETLKKGVKTFRDGLNDFDTDEFTKLGGNNLRMLKRRILALKEADILYDNFSGKPEGVSSDVIFIVETEEIKAD